MNLILSGRRERLDNLSAHPLFPQLWHSPYNCFVHLFGPLEPAEGQLHGRA